MLTPDDVRRLALALPGAADESTDERLLFTLDGDKLAWTFLERFHPKKPRRPKLDVLVVACPLERKDLLVEAAPDRFFDDDHYRGYPAVMVRLDAVEEDELASLLEGAVALSKAKASRRPSRRKAPSQG